MFSYLRRLVTTGASYTASSIIAKLFAVILLPVYTGYLTTADYGAAEVLLASVVVMSIIVRLGIVEALMRFYFRFDSEAERNRAVRSSFTLLLLTTTVGAGIAAIFAGPLSQLVLGEQQRELMLIAIYGLWIFTNYELLLALFRLDERAKDYFAASLSNVLITIGLTLWLVVVKDEGAKGLLLGNFLGSTALYVVLLYVQRRRLGPGIDGKLIKPMLRFGGPTVPAEISIYSLNFADRLIITHSAGLGQAGVYSIAIKFSQVVTVLVRAFQLAWPPLAYSIKDDDEARRFYGFIITYYVLICGTVVLALALLSRWVLRLLVAHQYFSAYFPAYKVIPLVATGIALFGLYLILVVVMGRVGRTGFNFPVTGAAMAANIGLNLLLVPKYGIVGAGVSLIGSYLLMLALMYTVSRRYFAVPVQWLRLAHIVLPIAAIAVFAEMLVPTAGVAGFVERCGLLALFPLFLYTTGFLHVEERHRIAALITSARSAKPFKRGETLDESTELMRELHDSQDPD